MTRPDESDTRIVQLERELIALKADLVRHIEIAAKAQTRCAELENKLQSAFEGPPINATSTAPIPPWVQAHLTSGCWLRREVDGSGVRWYVDDVEVKDATSSGPKEEHDPH